MLVLAVMLLPSSLHALSITPGAEILKSNTIGPGMPAIRAAIASAIGNATELYKKDAKTLSEGGGLAGSYETSFLGTAGDCSGATISHVGGTFVQPNAYLLVKDGNHTPMWYLFDLSNSPFDWNGTETLELSGFWAGVGGSISHVSIYGASVPDGGATVAMLGLGLLGLAVWNRRRKPNHTHV